MSVEAVVDLMRPEFESKQQTLRANLPMAMASMRTSCHICFNCSPRLIVPWPTSTAADKGQRRSIARRAQKPRIGCRR
jgi:hypothetical protein